MIADRFLPFMLSFASMMPLALAQSIGGWGLSWNDEFSTAGKIDQGNWTYDFSKSMVREAVGKEENARIENGLLIIEAVKTGSNGFTSAGITSKKV